VFAGQIQLFDFLNTGSAKTEDFLGDAGRRIQDAEEKKMKSR